MSSEVAAVPLEDCLDALIDYRGKTPVKTLSGIPLITAKIIKAGRIEKPTEFIAKDNYDSWMRRGIPKAGDVVLTVEAPLGEVAQLGAEKIALAQRVVTLRGKVGVLDNTYLLYLLQTEEMQEQLKARATGTTVLGIKQSELRKVLLRLPTIEAQVSAAATLKAIDDRIALLRETNTTLEAIAQALFKSWFVDFDPVNAKAQGNAPEGMDKATAALVPDSFEESELGLVPKGWKAMPFLDACDLLGGSQPPASCFVDEPREGYVRLLQIRDFSTDAHKTFIPDTSKLKKVNDDDVLIGRYGSASGDKARDSLGRVCRGLSGAYNVALMKLNPIKVGREFALQMVTDPRFYGYLQGVSSKAVQSGFSKSELGQYKVVIPTREIAELYESFGVTIWNRVKGGEEMQYLLSELRDTLLPRLISGHLRLPEQDDGKNFNGSYAPCHH